ncbi:unnamed protein product [Acanthoscelides obtectus]|uniref:Uncharacterized protein n=1 Tax=Acanthoscelides obtectus TaxID=200917 RepID=A0A9P0JIW7_ACAOB|nr:unnamed protein product [Acanthoscelides obtectus]CAK1625014.1 hypothetical protein AOBTE_LOCUS2891 [Acanthoscelides obtectus]
MYSYEDDLSAEVIPKKRKKGEKQVIYKNEVIKGARVRGVGHAALIKFPKQEMFDIFYALEMKNEQDAYMQAPIECSEISRKQPRVEQNNAKPKSKSYKYCVFQFGKAPCMQNNFY